MLFKQVQTTTRVRFLCFMFR